MAIYGEDFAAVYNRDWAWFSNHVWPFLEEQVARNRPNAQSWLDLCCGCGALLKLIGEAGYDSVGLDLSRHQLQHASENAPEARLVEADVREFSLGRQFDVVTCLFDSLNYLTRLEELREALVHARHHLAENGLLIFDLNTFHGLQENWCRTEIVRGGDRIVVCETSFDGKRARGLCRITGFVRQEGELWRRFEEDHYQRAYRTDEVAEVLEAVGLAYRDYDGKNFGPAGERSSRIFYVCRALRRQEGQR